MFFLPNGYCFGKRMRISHKNVNFLTDFVLFYQKNTKSVVNHLFNHRNYIEQLDLLWLVHYINKAPSLALLSEIVTL